MPKVSVVIASYNHEAYVRAAIESVLDQSFEDFEIVITDDGSSDQTTDEVRKIKDRRISLHAFPENRGACVAMNASIRRARGRYIAVLNSDDLFLAGKLEKQVGYLDSHPEVGALFAYPKFVNPSGETIPDDETFYKNIFRVENRSREGWLRHFFFQGNVLCHPSVLIRKRCYERVGLYNAGLAQLPDLEMWVRVLSQFDIHILKEPLVGFRILDGNRNASAPRPEVVVRLEWERRKVLDQYLMLDGKTLRAVFPELPSSSNEHLPKWLKVIAQRALHRYLVGSGANVAVADAEPSRSASEVPQVLSRLALQVGRPAHVAFALDLMYSTFRKNDDESQFRELIHFTGAFDPFGMLFGLPSNRSISAMRGTSGSLRAVR
jgi:glycosyltransferase involved in cell wall biosynthesis